MVKSKETTTIGVNVGPIKIERSVEKVPRELLPTGIRSDERGNLPPGVRRMEKMK